MKHSEPTKRVVVLGSTGSIGTQTLEVCRWRGYKVVGLVAGKNLDLLGQQIEEFQPEVVSANESLLPELMQRQPKTTVAEAVEVAQWPADVVVAAVPGLAGLPAVGGAT